MNTVNLCPAPPAPYFTVDFHLSRVNEAEISLMHANSLEYEKQLKRLKETLFQLLSIPSDFELKIFPNKSAVGNFICSKLAGRRTFFFTFGLPDELLAKVIQINHKVNQKELLEEKDFTLTSTTIPPGTDLISVAQGDLNTGRIVPLDEVYALKERSVNQSLCLDLSTGVPTTLVDFRYVDCVYFGIQHGFGFNSDLTILIHKKNFLVNDKDMENNHAFHGSINMLDVHLLLMVVQDLLQKGIESVRRETDYKAAVIYHLLEESKTLNPFVLNKEIRSKTCITASSQHSQALKSYLQDHHFDIGIYAPKNQPPRLQFANYPTHSKEIFERLADVIAQSEINS